MASDKKNEPISDREFDSLLAQIKKLVNQSRNYAYRQINALAVITNYETGRIIVESCERIPRSLLRG